jgi:hypothetical protein
MYGGRSNSTAMRRGSGKRFDKYEERKRRQSIGIPDVQMCLNNREAPRCTTPECVNRLREFQVTYRGHGRTPAWREHYQFITPKIALKQNVIEPDYLIVRLVAIDMFGSVFGTRAVASITWGNEGNQHMPFVLQSTLLSSGASYRLATESMSYDKQRPGNFRP